MSACVSPKHATVDTENVLVLVHAHCPDARTRLLLRTSLNHTFEFMVACREHALEDCERFHIARRALCAWKRQTSESRVARYDSQRVGVRLRRVVNSWGGRRAVRDDETPVLVFHA